MANTYTYKKVEGDFEIYRSDEHVATFDPVTEDTTYTNGSDRFSGPIGRQVKKIARSYNTEEVEPEEVEPEDISEIVKLKQQNTLLRKEVNTLKRELNAPEGKVLRVHPRYEGIVFDNPDAPETIKTLGDLSPEFIEWARSGGWSEADFLQVYTGRIDDITYKG
jgi:hypothetical protein